MNNITEMPVRDKVLTHLPSSKPGIINSARRLIRKIPWWAGQHSFFVDLGTHKCIVGHDDIEGINTSQEIKNQIFFDEPSLAIAESIGSNKIIAIGKEAREKIRRGVDSRQILRPVIDGVVFDEKVAQAIMEYALRLQDGESSRKIPTLITGVPVNTSPTLRKALRDVAIRSGAVEVFIVEQPVLAAIGAGINLRENNSHIVIDSGGGTTNYALITEQGVIQKAVDTIGGDTYDKAFGDYVKQVLKANVNSVELQDLKVRMCTDENADTKEYTVPGKNNDGEHIDVKIKVDALDTAIAPHLEELGRTARRFTMAIPESFSGDIRRNGIIFTGNSSLIRGLPTVFADSTGLPMAIVPNPRYAVASGMEQLFHDRDLLQQLALKD